MEQSDTSRRRHHPPRRGGAATSPSQPTETTARQPKPRLTHFLALPIGHHADLRQTVTALTSSWLAHEPPIDGLDPSIVINPRRLHLTLGVMSLAAGTSRDLAGARALLDSLRPRILELLAHTPLLVRLDKLATMQPDPTCAHVLYAAPDVRSSEGRRLRAVAEFVHGAFKQAGFLVDERRPLKLHCTILNTTYRRPPPGQRRATGRMPFSYAAFPPPAPGGTEGLGVWSVDELQICEMGSWAPDGAYVRVAGCNLRSMI
ncbi:kinase A anchor protein [Gloeopeniophorella convolvens]|nr:kinase A anchor protein [Gloeopeniophorella convolvens]